MTTIASGAIDIDSFISWESEAFFQDPTVNADKWYRCTVIAEGDAKHSNNVRVVFQWGRRGSAGQSQVAFARDVTEGFNIASAKFTSKTSKGYVARSRLAPRAPSVEMIELAYKDEITPERAHAAKRIGVISDVNQIGRAHV